MWGFFRDSNQIHSCYKWGKRNQERWTYLSNNCYPLQKKKYFKLQKQMETWGLNRMWGPWFNYAFFVEKKKKRENSASSDKRKTTAVYHYVPFTHQIFIKH